MIETAANPNPLDTSVSSADRAIALVVDLDGTLCRTDTLWECFFIAWASDLLLPLRVIAWLFTGRAALKRELASRAQLSADALPWNPAVLGALRDARDAGRRTVLATAAHRDVADACAGAIGLFDDVLATEGDVNLKSDAKANALTTKYGARGFDYIGDSRADIAVWRAARTGWTVSNIRPDGVQSLVAVNETNESSSFASWTKLLRVRHWIKNILVFVALFAAHRWMVGAAWIASVQTFVAFCAVCSGIYVFNDLFDLRSDRLHPTKRLRPLARGVIALPSAAFVGALLLVAGLALAFYVSTEVGLIVATYCIANVGYTLWLKRQAVADVSVLAALYTLRILAGVAAIVAPLSPWLFAFSVFAFLSLALLKRAVDLNRLQPDEKLAGRGYTGRDAAFVNVFGAGASIAAVLVLSLYVASPQMSALYKQPQWLWLILAVVLFWLMRMWQLAMSGRGDDDPVLFATKDPLSWGCGAVCAVFFAMAL
jgi:4-hydroxybenzoate polyprenyltransferase/phosphoglycolate phosphatase-like HAD superfamily hydrolase